ncbi:MAG: peptidylprolyl isomerase [Candidatus Melainabacteria bacterium]|nr:peptidylprolyl isomerase [Candidatus Melainabacteria bacterium]
MNRSYQGMCLFSKASQHLLMAVVLCVVALTLITSGVTALSGEHGKDKILIGKKEKMTTTDPTVVMETTKGTIKIQVFKNDSPITANNFLDLVQRGFYNGLTFHRYEPGFVIQGGDPKGDGTGGFIDPQTKTERRIPLEVKPGLRHDSQGVLAMARSSDPNSASSQFYITLGAASFLDMQYAVFGKVIDGMSVVQQLRKGDHMTKVSMLEPAAR